MIIEDIRLGVVIVAALFLFAVIIYRVLSPIPKPRVKTERELMGELIWDVVYLYSDMPVFIDFEMYNHLELCISCRFSDLGRTVEIEYKDLSSKSLKKLIDETVFSLVTDGVACFYSVKSDIIPETIKEKSCYS